MNKLWAESLLFEQLNFKQNTIFNLFVLKIKMIININIIRHHLWFYCYSNAIIITKKYHIIHLI